MEPTPADVLSDHLIGSPLPWITANFVGLGGLSKVHAEDFFVEEIPAYPPDESGEFLFLWVEKQGLSSEQLVSHLARCLKIAHQDVGIAGMKDRQAVTRQMVSVPVKPLPHVDSFVHEPILTLEPPPPPHHRRLPHLPATRFPRLL